MKSQICARLPLNVSRNSFTFCNVYRPLPADVIYASVNLTVIRIVYYIQLDHDLPPSLLEEACNSVVSSLNFIVDDE